LIGHGFEIKLGDGIAFFNAFLNLNAVGSAEITNESAAADDHFLDFVFRMAAAKAHIDQGENRDLTAAFGAERAVATECVVDVEDFS